MNTTDPAAFDQRLAQAVALHQAGKLEAARTEYEALLSQAPQRQEVSAYLGLLCFQTGQAARAVSLMEQGRVGESTELAWLWPLAQAYRTLERDDKAAEVLEHALRLDPASIPVLGHLGLSYEALGRLDEAQRCYETILTKVPNDPATLVNLGAIFYARRQYAQAIECYRLALATHPGMPEAHYNLACALRDTGELEAALPHFDVALKQYPERPDGWGVAGKCLLRLGKYMAALTIYQEAVRLAPENGDFRANLALLLNLLSRFDEAIIVARAGLEAAPSNPALHYVLGLTLGSAWRMSESLHYLKRALRAFPKSRDLWTTYLLHLHYVPTPPEKLIAAHVRFGREVGNQRPWAPFSNERDPARRLRVGYVSADFNNHSVAFFALPFIAHHNREQVEVYCYYNSHKRDSVTDLIRANTDHWRAIASLDDAAFADQVRMDAVDILVDLSGHTGDNRLLAFAKRLAPVQVTYLGYPDTTGLTGIDYRITDAWADPPGQTERWHTETLVRLPSGFLCYDLPRDAPPVGPLPVQTSGQITFASFNNLSKVTPQVIALWCRILAAVPGSRLLLKSTTGWEGQSEMKARLLDCFAANGVESARVVLLERTATINEHLALYGQVDVALDTYPYHGTTTTYEALTMGVPVVTLAGRVHASRVGVSILNRIGLPELVARTEGEYVDTAVAFASDLRRLAALRGELRGRMVERGLTDAARYCQELEAAYRDMWREYCEHGLRETRLPEISEPDPPARVLPLAAGERMWVPDDLHEITPYVLLEQEDWFEAEIDFLRQALAPGMRVLDVGASYGVYTVASAKAVGPSGRVWAVEPVAKACRYLRRTLAEESLNQVTLIEAALSDFDGRAVVDMGFSAELNKLGAGTTGEQVSVRCLDSLCITEGVDGLDFVKLDAEGQEEAIVRGGENLFTRESPLIMLAIMHGEQVNIGALEALRRLGYQAYRLVPGLGLLAPWIDYGKQAVNQLNLFCCKADRAALLAQGGMLALADGTQRTPPSARVAQAYLAKCEFAVSMDNVWQFKPGLAGGRHALAALDDYALSQDVQRGPRERLALLERALLQQTKAIEELRTVTRLSTLARLQRALGVDPHAVRSCIEEAIMWLASEVENKLSVEPFLPASPEFDAMPMRDGRWLLAMLKTAREETRAYSSYFTPDESYRAIKEIVATGYVTPEMERRRQLIRLRYDLQECPEWQSALKGTRNLAFWQGETAGTTR